MFDEQVTSANLFLSFSRWRVPTALLCNDVKEIILVIGTRVTDLPVGWQRCLARMRRVGQQKRKRDGRGGMVANESDVINLVDKEGPGSNVP